MILDLMLYFTEQGSSASQMTAAKVVGCHSKTKRLSRTCGRRGARLHPTMNGEMFQNCSNFQSHNVQMYGYASHDTKGLNHGETLRIQLFFSNEICKDIHLLASCGKDSSRKFFVDMDGKCTKLGMSVCSSKTRIAHRHSKCSNAVCSRSSIFATHYAGTWTRMTMD